MTGTVTYIRWDPPIDTDLPVLAAVWQDIWSAKMLALELRDILAVIDERRIRVEPLAVAALTKYFRAFGSGRRPKKLRLDEAPDLAERLKGAHNHLRAIRDMHFAHPVNRYETYHVSLGIADLGAPTARATAVSGGTTAIHGLASDEVGDLVALCDYWLGRLEGEKEAAGALLLIEAQKLSPAQLNALESGWDEPDENPFSHR